MCVEANGRMFEWSVGWTDEASVLNSISHQSYDFSIKSYMEISNDSTFYVCVCVCACTSLIRDSDERSKKRRKIGREKVAAAVVVLFPSLNVSNQIKSVGNELNAFERLWHRVQSLQAKMLNGKILTSKQTWMPNIRTAVNKTQKVCSVRWLGRKIRENKE